MNRREFLSTSVVVAAAAAVPQSQWIVASEPPERHITVYTGLLDASDVEAVVASLSIIQLLGGDVQRMIVDPELRRIYVPRRN